MISACGVICSECPAFHGAAKGRAHQRRTVQAWQRIYGLREPPENVSCGGCLGPDHELFHTSRRCGARRCCLGKGYATCAECPKKTCPDLERAQAVWDGVPETAAALSRTDYVRYAKAYCGHRERLAAARRGARPHRDAD